MNLEVIESLDTVQVLLGPGNSWQLYQKGPEELKQGNFRPSHSQYQILPVFNNSYSHHNIILDLTLCQHFIV